MIRILIINLCSCLLLLLAVGSPCCQPASAQSQQDGGKFSKHYIAQDSEEEYSEEVVEEQSAEEGTAQEGTAQEGSEAASDGGGERVSLATVFLSGIGMVILIVFLLAIPISFSFLACGLVWKIGMLARGGKKPDIG